MCACRDCYESLTPAQRAAMTNGCGGAGGFLSLRPPHWWGLEPDCCAHDVLYTRGGTAEDRLAADRCLRDLIRAHAAGAAWWLRGYYRAQAWIYYAAVRLFGGSFFNWQPRRLTCAEAAAWVAAHAG